MEQRNYELEIVLALLKKETHVRALAKQIGVNHMTISRKIKSLLEDNVVDFNEQGKNKIYFLKKTSEAKSFIFMAENYKLNQTLKKYPLLRGVIQEVQESKKIKIAILFGSYAKGIPHKDSDIDVYLETSDFKLKEEIESLNTRLNVKIGKYNKGNLLMNEIEKNHIIIKGVEKFYEHSKFFERSY